MPKGRLFGLQGFVAQGPRGRFLVIRGSDSVQDWLVNFEDETVKLEHGFGPEVKVHNGFKEMFDGAYKVVEPVLQQGDRHYGDLPIWVIGHSLGGAQALLFGAVLAKQGFKVGAVVTLAQPRVGNESFAIEAAQVLGDRYVTIAHELDIVPHTPATVVAAAAAAHFLAGTPIPKMPGDIKQTYETNDYRHFGVRYILGADRVVTRATTSYDDDNLRVFEALNKEAELGIDIGSKVNPVKKTRLLTERIAEHFPQQIFCKMAQAASVQAVSDW